MAILKRLTQKEIEESFSHYARFAGIVPCYFSAEARTGWRGPEGCVLQERNWIPEFVLTAAIALYGAFIFTVDFIVEDYEASWPIVLTGPIDRRAK